MDMKYNKKTLGLSILALLVAVVVVSTAVYVTQKEETPAGDHSSGTNMSSSAKAVEAVCKPTLHKEVCMAKLSAATNSTDTKDLVEVAFNVTVQEISDVMAKSKLLRNAAKDPRTSKAFDVCHDLLEDSIDDIKRALNRLTDYTSAATNLDLFMNDIKIWLSGALTFENTCLDGFLGTQGDSGDKMKQLLVTAQQLTGNTLEMVDEIHQALTALDIQGLNRKLLVVNSKKWPTFLPTGWWNSDDEITLRRSMLLESGSDYSKAADVIVAKDGSGKYTTINEALNDIPLESTKPFVIYIKSGVYAEHVVLEKKMTNVVFVGDGPTITKISGDRSYVSGYQTSETATLTIKGDGFIGKDIGVENTAGPSSHQAVALRVQADRAMFFNCQIDGNQDTLYVHAHRQFYRDCTITGTIDFIFGNAAAVFQNCSLIIRRPLVTDGSSQSCMVTAQGRSQADEPTGIVIVDSSITASPEYLSSTAPIVSFLGRPWRQYARVVIMNTKIDVRISPEGWAPFQGTFGLEDCWYGEFGNSGEGADVSGRAKWAGIKGAISEEVAEGFLPGNFILGDSWIPLTALPYAPGFMQGGGASGGHGWASVPAPSPEHY
ncbi:unnamed protein product [Cuscuta epithymum]|uniref:Pectinesterase n=1 Tax=Cuscuta epithymum TaxID=186058 RepID=A0AAV0C075_9ASTE|nr:unnamed protein product [Cuscuta epithymum]